MKHDSKDRTVRTKELGTRVLGQLGQESLDRTGRTGQQEKTVRIIQAGQKRADRMARTYKMTGQLRWDYRGRTAVTM
jgi:hypothetical protein